MHQKTFAEAEYDRKKRKTRRGRGRQPYPLRVMLRIHCVQRCYHLSDPAMEDLLYEVVGRGLFDEINGHLASQSLSLKEGAIDEASLVAAAPFTKHVKGERDSTDRLLHGAENRVWTDAGYRGVQKRPEHRTRSVDWNVAMAPSIRRELPNDSPKHRIEKIKASIRTKVEHPFRYVKQVLDCAKVRLQPE